MYYLVEVEYSTKSGGELTNTLLVKSNCFKDKIADKIEDKFYKTYGKQNLGYVNVNVKDTLIIEEY